MNFNFTFIFNRKEIRRLGEFIVDNNREMKHENKVRLIIALVLTALVMGIFLKINNFDMKMTALVTSVSCFIIYAVGRLLIFINRKIDLNMTMRNLKSIYRDGINVCVQGEKIFVRKGNSKYEYMINDTDLEYCDDKIIFLKFKDEAVISIPNKVFDADYERDEFIKLFKSDEFKEEVNMVSVSKY